MTIKHSISFRVALTTAMQVVSGPSIARLFRKAFVDHEPRASREVTVRAREKAHEGRPAE